MRVILKEALKGRGIMGDEINVADGYARNFLIPRDIAVRATKTNKIAFDNEMNQKRKKIEKLKKEASAAAEKMGTITLTFVRKAGEEGKLYGSVTTQEIADKLKESGFEVEKRKIHLSAPVKSVGSYIAHTTLFQEIEADIKIEVVAEKEPEVAGEAKAEASSSEAK